MTPFFQKLKFLFHNKTLKMKPITLHSKLLQTYKLSFLVFLLVFTFNFSSIASANYFNDSDVIKINPAFKIKRYSNGNVIAYKAIDDGAKVEYYFKDLNGDILLAAIRKQKLSSVILSLSRKYELSEMECRRRIKHSINVLEEWGIIVKRDKLMVKKDM